MKFFLKILIFITLSLSLIWLLNDFYYIDKVECINPIIGNKAILLRIDSRGRGEFGAPRSGNRTHKGIDILADIGTPVVAVKSGIAIPGEIKTGMGKFVKIRHSKRLETIYGHLSKVYVKPYQKVRQGDIIGEVGNTGNARYKEIKPHVHFEIKIEGKSVDPFESLLPPALLYNDKL